MGWQKTHEKIREKLIGYTDKKALLVEGDNDERLFRILLSRRFRHGWENRWVLAVAGGENNVIRILEVESNWVGIIDRDEWDEKVIAEKKSKFNNLFVLPRFCLESYAIDPDELWQALPAKMQGKVDGGHQGLKKEILKDKDQWLRHGVLWSVINPLWTGLRSLGFKEKLLNFDAAQNDDTIKETLKEWHGFLDPDTLFSRFKEKLEEAKQASPKEQITKWIHGKHFFRKKVHPILNRYLGQEKVETRLNKIFNNMNLPDDLEPLWTRITQ